MTPLAELFPDSDFRFHLTLRRGEPQAFFRCWDTSGRVLEERKQWLADAPDRYSGLLREGKPLLSEFTALCGDWNVPAMSSTIVASPMQPELKEKSLVELGAAVEPDFLLL